MERRNPVIRGRVVAIDGDEAMVRSERTTDRALVRGGDGLTVGDIVEIDAAGNARVLTRSRRPPSFMTRVLDPRRLRGIEVRSLVEQGIREYFAAQGFRETRTPLLVPCPGMEPHIRPFRAHAYGIPETDTPAFLPTSPEFAMKRLLVGGLERIFQMTPVFRHEPTSPCHIPEITKLEWYLSL
ncbi:MAG: hypothetical protein HY698_13400, partial [Deltaproteobacteria bacterium]|nr:hypothetical protein [Deltaproteobacteria bacterium]